MACKHERIKSVNCVIFCDICGEQLPVDYLVGKERIAAQKDVKPAPKAKGEEITAEAPEAAKTPVKGEKKTTRKKVTK